MTDRHITEEDLHAFIDGRLDGQRSETVRTYLAAHPEKAETVAAYSADRQMLRDALQPVAKAPIPPSLDIRRMAEARRLSNVTLWRLPMAASIALAIGLGGGWLIRGAAMPAQNGVAALGREAADNYRVYAYDANRPVEIAATDEAKLVRWVSNRLQRPVAAPNLSQTGFRLIGGRLVTTPHGPAAMFLYDGAQGQRLAVLIRPMAIDKQTRMSEQGFDGLGGVSWAEKGLGYSLVGPASARELHPLADEVRRELRKSI
jgi:anti-sigma factor RsiW